MRRVRLNSQRRNVRRVVYAPKLAIDTSNFAEEMMFGCEQPQAREWRLSVVERIMPLVVYL